MKDRIPTSGYANRKAFTLEGVSSLTTLADVIAFLQATFYGKADYADVPTEEGTPLNKANLLSDAAATALGLTQADPVPSDAFSAAGTQLSALETGKADLDANSKVKPEQVSARVVAVSASKTLALADAGIGQRCTNTAAISITIPANAAVAFPVDTEIEIYRGGTGAVTIAAASGVTIQCSGAVRTVSDRYTSVFLKQWATDIWSLQGNVG